MNNTLSKVIKALKLSLFSFSVADNLLESFIRWDFKIGDARSNLMQMCFSPVASFWLIAVLLLAHFDPTRASWSLTNLFGYESPLIMTMLDGRLSNMILFFFIFYVVEWVIRKETLLMILIGFLLSKGEWHLNIAVSSVLGIYLSRISYHMWAGLDLESEAKSVWIRVHQLQLLGYFIFSSVGLWFLDYVQTGFMFEKTGLFTRLNFLVLLIVFFHAINQLLLSLWGHFYFKKAHEPSDVIINYSSANFILRFIISKPLIKQIIEASKSQIQKNEKNMTELKKLEKIHPAIMESRVFRVLEKTQNYLKEAQSRAVRA